MENTSGEQYRTQEAVRELLALLSLYTQFLERQLASVRGDMAATVDSLMQQVSMISAARGTQAKMADTILVKGQDRPADDHFVAASVKEVEQAEQARLVAELESRKGFPSANVTEVGTRLRAHMGSLDHLDNRLEGMLFTIVGALSTEDVVGQRLAHISQALAHLKDGISEVVAWPEENYSPPNIDDVTERIKAKTYQGYTMEAEKKIFVDVYGAVPKKKSV